MEQLMNIARLVKVCGQVTGRKKFQKIVHVLQEAGYPFREEFDYLHYGPYSSQLKSEIDDLTERIGLLDEESDTTEVVGYQTYRYSPSDRLDSVLDALGMSDEPDWASLARDLNGETAQFLEAVSTILFLLRRGFAGDRLKERFCEVKPDLVSMFERAYRKAEQIKEWASSKPA